MDNAHILLVIFGMTAVTVITRSFFFISKRPWNMPEWLTRGLRYAPLAALVAATAPAILLSADGQGLIHTFKDARIYALFMAFVVYRWRRGLLSPILAGTAVYLPLHVFLGW